MNDTAGPGRMMLFSLATAAAILMVAGSMVGVIADPGPITRAVLAIVPMAPLAALAWAIHQAVRRLDELQRRIHLDALTGAFVGTAFLAVTVGQLQHAKIGIPDLNWAYLWPAQVVLWAIAYFVASRRYQ
jgi:hypothetical protein